MATAGVSHCDEAVVAELDAMRRCRVSMSADHTEGEKQKGNALRIGRGALLD